MINDPISYGERYHTFSKDSWKTVESLLASLERGNGKKYNFKGGLNRAGKYPIVSIISGVGRIIIGVAQIITGIFLTIIFLPARICSSKDSEWNKGHALNAHHSWSFIVHGLGNIVRGSFETSWILSLLLFECTGIDEIPTDQRARRLKYLDEPKIWNPGAYHEI